MKKICKNCGAEAGPRDSLCRSCGSDALVLYEPPRSGGRAIGSFLLWFGIWLAAQFVVSVAFVVPIAASVLSDVSALLKGSDYVVKLITEQISRHMTLISVLSSVLFLVVAAAVFAVRQKRRDRRGVIPEKNYFREIGLVKAPLTVCAASLGLGAVLNRAVTYIVAVIPWPDSFVDSFDETYEPLVGAGSPWVLVILSTVVIAPVTEEVLFRGIACSRFSPAFPHVLAVILSSLFFGMAHGTPIAVIYASAFGVVQACIFLRHGSLYPVMLCHFGFNLTATLLPDLFGNAGVDIAVFLVCAAASAAGIMFVTKDNKKELPEAGGNNEAL